MNWYYSTGGDPIGPHSEDEIERLLQGGQISADTLVWRKGLAEWPALADTEEFARRLDDAAPPPVPASRQQATRHDADELLVEDRLGDFRPGDDRESDHRGDDRLDDHRGNDRLSADEPLHGFTAANVAPSLAGPWSRYFARSIDLMILLSVLLTALYWVLPMVSPKLALQIYFVDWRLMSVLLVPFALLLNAIIITLFGNSLGKAIFAIRAEPLDGRARFGFGGNLMREFRVWTEGLVLCIPLLNLFTMIPAYRAVLRGAPAGYDIGRATVRAYSENRVRRTLGMLFALALYAGITVLNGMDRAAMDELARPAIWTNPATGLETTIPGGWTYEQVTGPEGTPLHGFTKVESGLVAFFALETMPSLDMAGYLRALTQGMSASTALGNWSMSPHPGVWTASGQMAPSGYPSTVYAAQNGTQFWRLVYIDQFSKTPRVIAEPEMTAALFRSVGVGAAP